MDMSKITPVNPHPNTDNRLKSEKTTNKGSEANRPPVDDVAATYEPSRSKADDSLGKMYSPDTETISRLKADVEMRTEQLRSLVERLLLQQGHKLNDATNIYALLREGKVQVDPETVAKAQAEISEEGYWGVKQTSQRIFDFAIALTGGDPSKAQAMKEAVKKGFAQAQEMWGGELPEISQKTYEETLKKFDEWIGSNEKE
ncbi:hypothetical protein Desdi_1528 [Desulfitobacterium dichloroeliminans LMG P-21439]|uniref:Uncharacterized protein n=1 Tax=Desulfitobacterium dichloroeliminans (strain LMG P-21439 / DCA1) TaxID=871963 RepID=L0F8R5_DESDL|nr:hypothetical protein [Desulfitobacterium dichloroeliminans]AGA69021.1 hypothetical protein Desdi_1528 [Desulfitobacterium dichloroeliminans LMG P-21439]